MTDNGSGSRELSGSARRVRKGAARIGATDANQRLMLSIYLRLPPNAPPLRDMDYYAARPFGPREHMSRAEYARMYSAAAEDLQAVTDFAAARGLDVVETHPARRLVQVSGTAAQLADIFNVELFDYQSPKETYRGHEGPITLPAAIAGVVEGVFGLDNRGMARSAGSGGIGAGVLTPPQVAAAYNFPTNLATGQTIAVLEFSGPTTGATSEETPVCGFEQSDIAGYIQYLNGSSGLLTSPTINFVTVDQAPNTLGGSLTSPSVADLEVAADLEVIASVAQGAEIVAYFAPGTEQGWVDAVNTIVTDSAYEPTVLSISWCWPEDESLVEEGPDAGPWPFAWTQQAVDQMTLAFQAAANIGMTVFAASGDFGADGEQDDGLAHVLYPASDPWVTACGGTIINTLSPLAEGTWNDNPPIGQPGATGGGISKLFPLPTWQANIGVPPSLSPPFAAGRGVPDVAGNASANSGYILYLYGKPTSELLNTPVGGTSVVAPLYAALMAIINAQVGDNSSVGFGCLNTTIYTLAESEGTTIFRDIADGATNSILITPQGELTKSPGYKSVAGWDACTGWGSINGTALLSALNLKPKIAPSINLILDRGAYGIDEVFRQLQQSPEAVFTNAVSVVADGFSMRQLGLTKMNLGAPPAGLLTFTGSLLANDANISLVLNMATGGVQVGNQDDLDTVQRVTFPYDVQLDSILDFTNGDYTLAAILTPPPPVASVQSQAADVEFVSEAFPYMISGASWWLSADMRVFTVTPATLGGKSPVPGSTTLYGPDPITYIQALLNELNLGYGDPLGPDSPFESLSTDEEASGLVNTQNDTHGNPVFNFALARVRLNGDTAANVRAFFRLFVSASPDTDYDPTTTYRTSNEIAGTLVPLLGFFNAGMGTSTIPFFATTRVDTSTQSMTTQVDFPNVQTISGPTPTPQNPNPSVYAYFGCWLDLNQSSGNQFPGQVLAQFPPNPQLMTNPDGPWPAGPSVKPIPAIIMGQHACLVTEIAYDPNPIVAPANASTSNQLGQRNLAWSSL